MVIYAMHTFSCEEKKVPDPVWSKLLRIAFINLFSVVADFLEISYLRKKTINGYRLQVTGMKITRLFSKYFLNISKYFLNIFWIFLNIF